MARSKSGKWVFESSRGPWSNDLEIDRLGEGILLSAGMVEEAYARYGLSANRASTDLGTFRAIARRYPEKEAAAILADLVDTTPGEEADTLRRGEGCRPLRGSSQLGETLTM